VDPALVEFDKRTTGIDQFCELTYAAHSLGARVFIDIVINHTGWGSTLQENHPEFFLKKPDGEFASPGAWGTVWEDLVELNSTTSRSGTSSPTRCSSGAGAAWTVSAATPATKFPCPPGNTSSPACRTNFPKPFSCSKASAARGKPPKALLTEGGMQWAYSELFQNYSGRDVAWYLDYANRQSERVGSYVHYSETHDNDRLAKKGRAPGRCCATASAR
jgi:starch synthase (maltosyl-transferring)